MSLRFWVKIQSHTLMMFPGQWWGPAKSRQWKRRGSSWWRRSRALAGQLRRGWAGRKRPSLCTFPAGHPWLWCRPSPRSYQQSGTGCRQGHTWGSLSGTVVTEHPTLHSTLSLCIRSSISRYLPHDYSDQPHNGFIETVKEVLERLPLFLHAPDDQTEADREYHHAESIEAINQARHWDQLLLGDPLAAVDWDQAVIHCNRNVDFSLGILRLELQRGWVEERSIPGATQFFINTFRQ